MNPEITPQANTGAPQGQAPLDPTVVALTKAIGKAESGGSYGSGDNTGDGANSSGAYQFTPGFLSEWAPKAGVNYLKGQTLTPAQQDQVAYNAVKTMGTTGDPAYPQLGKLSPAQIASAWNTGDPDAYLDPGYGKNNTYGSTANYVNKVSQYYDQDLQSSGGTQPQNQTASNPLIPSANASTGPVPQSSTASSSGDTSSLLEKVLGIGGGIVGGGALLLSMLDGTGEAALGADAATGGGLMSSIEGALGLQGAVGDIKNLFSGSSSSSGSSSDSGSSTPTQPNVEQEIHDLEANMPQAMKQSSALTNAIAQATSGTIGGRRLLDDPNIKESVTTMGHYGLAPNVDENGVMDFSQADANAKKKIGDLSKATTQMLIAGGEKAPVEDARKAAYQNIDKYVNTEDRAEAKATVDKLVNTYSSEYGDGQGNMSLGHFEKMKQETGHGQKWNINDSTAKKEAHKALSKGARNTIEKHTKHKELYNRTMKEEQKLINARKVMKHLDKKKAPKNNSLGKLLRTNAAKYAALYIGDKIGGPLGAVIGSLTGEWITRAIDKKHGKTIFETPAVHKGLKILQKDNPAVYKIIAKKLAEAGVVIPKPKEEKKAMLALPAGPIPLQGRGRGEYPGIVTQSKTPPVDYDTAHKMKHGKPQYGGIYEKNKQIEDAKKAAGLIGSLKSGR